MMGPKIQKAGPISRTYLLTLCKSMADLFSLVKYSRKKGGKKMGKFFNWKRHPDLVV
jgi:hypothetical protein